MDLRAPRHFQASRLFRVLSMQGIPHVPVYRAAVCESDPNGLNHFAVAEREETSAEKAIGLQS
jgi:hypothetical protein